MKKEVYKHLLRSYGHLPLLWVGVITEFFRALVQRVVVVLFVAQIASDIVLGDFDAAKRNLLLLVVVYALGAVVGMVGELLFIRTTDRKYGVLLMNYYHKLTSKDMAFYRDTQTGILSSLFRQHLDGTMTLVRLFRGDVIGMFVSLVFPIVVLLFIAGWKFGLVMALFVILQSWYALWSSNLMDKYRKSAKEIYRKLTGEVSDEVTNAVAFKSSGGEAEAHNKVAQLASQEEGIFWLRHKMTVLLDLPRTMLTILAIGAGIFIALVDSSANLESVRLVILIFAFMLQIMRSVEILPDLVLRHDEHIARVYSTLEYLGESYETIFDPVNPKQLNVTHGAIQVKNVDFAYKTRESVAGTNKVFKDLNLNIKGGEHVGIVGVSGVGKSTLAGLLMRFDDVDAGSISIDGLNIREVRQSELRQNIAYVPQEPLLFNRSIKENIAFFKRNASEEEILKAAKAAHAHEFIVNLENKYNTNVGERGVKLSAGQKQRIVIARAILKNAPIMIFDEATSALDSESELIVQNALPGIIGEHTALVIAHRLSTVARLDRIIVMHDGKIVEDGTHQELLALGARYHSLWQKQSSLVPAMNMSNRG